VPITIPVPFRVGPFKLRLMQAKTGGSLIAFGMKFSSGSRSEIQLFRLDYHGDKNTDDDATPFQVGPKLPGEASEPWFHYHTPAGYVTRI
jgi:hypothetical protein